MSTPKGQINGYGQREPDGTYKAIIEITGLRDLDECEVMSTLATTAVAEMIGALGGNPELRYDIRDGGPVQ